MMRSLVALVFTLTISPCPLRATEPEYPKIQIPASDRVLSLAEVKNYWLHVIRNSPIPPKPNGLHPDKQRAWRKHLELRKSYQAAILAGALDEQAELAQLAHNAEAWRRLGNESESIAATQRLRELKAHMAGMETLEQQRRTAAAQEEVWEQWKSQHAWRSCCPTLCPEACVFDSAAGQ